MKQARVLAVDDDKSILLVLKRLLTEMGLQVATSDDGVEASKLLSGGSFALALLDINVPGMNGLELLKETRERELGTAVVIMTGEQTMTNAIEAMKLGAFDYISKPFDISEVEIVIERALENVKLKNELDTVKERLKEKLTEETSFVGKSRPVETVFKTVGKVSTTDATVLLTGESGTGKELLAKLLHSNSLRSNAPFVAVNTAAVPKELMESELFGHEKGAFTGAAEQRKGKFELADNGTLFLDEVGDTTLELQARLLRALQEQEFYRVGGKEPVKVNVRIIAATNQNLERAVEEGRFREDLYFRLNVVRIELPPLRDRTGDIEILSDYFLQKFSAEMGVERKKLSDGALAEIEGYAWPGNVRELENTLRRAALLSQTVVIKGEDLAIPKKRQKRRALSDIITDELAEFIEKTPASGPQELYNTIMPIMERPLIRLVLKKTGGNQVHASELLGINRNTLRKKIKELNIDLSEIKG